MTEITVYAIVKVKIKSKLSKEEAIAELESESLYNIDSTENVEVEETEWLGTSEYLPYI